MEVLEQDYITTARAKGLADRSVISSHAMKNAMIPIPIFASGPTASAVYDWLLAWRKRADGTYAVEPQLAQAFETFPNKIVFHLRDGVKFHDGSDLNADVVVWNVNRMIKNPKSFAKNLLSAVDDKEPAVALDPMTVQVNLTRPSAAVLSSLSDASSNGGGTTAIVSKKAADDHGEDWLKLNPVGTGPFRFVSFASGDKLVLQRNENYWKMGTDGKPLPYLDGVPYRVIIEATTQFNEMRSATSDFAQNVLGRDVPAAKQIAHARYIESPFSGNKRQYSFNSLKPPFQDDLLVTWAEGGNSAYHRAKVPGLIDTLHQADAEYDPAKRQALFVQAQQLMYDSAWFGYLWFEPGNFLVHQRIQGFPATWGSLRESEWWVNAT